LQGLLHIFLLIAITLLPIGLWGVYFYKANPRKQRISTILKMFVLGMFSILPPLAYHNLFFEPFQEWLRGTFPDVSVLVLSLMSLAMTFLFTAVAIVLFVLMNALILMFFYKLPWKEGYLSLSKKLYNLTPLIVFFLMFFALEVGLTPLGYSFLLSVAGNTLLLAVHEEYFKFLINPFLVYKKINSVGEAMVNAMYIGLAFSFVENLLFLNALTFGEKEFLTVYAFRSLFTTLVHVCASGILGYFYGTSLFAKSLVAEHEIEKSEYRVMDILRRIGFRKKNFFQSVSITQGFFISGLLHAFFNVMILLGHNGLAAGLVLLFSAIIVAILKNEKTQTQYGIIGTPAMPEGDFEQLRLKISVMQHLRDIQASQNPLPAQNKSR
jgi:RsiW-degrading membrane proteinase PrsW (M82 family)